MTPAFRPADTAKTQRYIAAVAAQNVSGGGRICITAPRSVPTSEICIRENISTKSPTSRQWQHHWPSGLDFIYPRGNPGKTSSTCKHQSSNGLRELELNQFFSRPMHALIFTGNDSPENLVHLLGPNWKGNKNRLSEYHQLRIEILLNPVLGSPARAVNARLQTHSFMDRVIEPNDIPRVVHTPEEVRLMMIIKVAQEVLKNQIALDKLKPRAEITENDLRIAFVPKLPRGHYERYATFFRTAARIMDQGLPYVNGQK
jgi:hypothetical protein